MNVSAVDQNRFIAALLGTQRAAGNATLRPIGEIPSRHERDAIALGSTRATNEQPIDILELSGITGDEANGATTIAAPQDTHAANMPSHDAHPGSAARESKGLHGQESLSPEEEKQVRELKKRDAEVRRHEQAHKAAAGSHAAGGPQFEYETGPDGKQYAVGGEVQVDTSSVSGDPQATITKMQQVRRAALAPASPSGQDRAVAAKAMAAEREARMELTKKRREKSASVGSAGATNATGSAAKTSKAPGPQHAATGASGSSTDAEERLPGMFDRAHATNAYTVDRQVEQPPVLNLVA